MINKEALRGGASFILGRNGLQRTTDPISGLNDLPERAPAVSDDLSSLNFIATILSSKWKLPVVYALKNRTKRYYELQNHLPKVTQKVLTTTLRHLERDGLVKRKIHPTIPPKVEYRLTPLGLELLLMTQKVSEWAETNEIISEAIKKTDS